MNTQNERRVIKKIAIAIFTLTLTLPFSSKGGTELPSIPAPCTTTGEKLIADAFQKKFPQGFLALGGCRDESGFGGTIQASLHGVLPSSSKKLYPISYQIVTKEYTDIVPEISFDALKQLIDFVENSQYGPSVKSQEMSIAIYRRFTPETFSVLIRSKENPSPYGNNKQYIAFIIEGDTQTVRVYDRLQTHDAIGNPLPLEPIATLNFNQENTIETDRQSNPSGIKKAYNSPWLYGIAVAITIAGILVVRRGRRDR